jgi:hypothetical protein
MLSRSLEEGYVISSFEKYDENNRKTIILRHDIDYTLDGLKEFAYIEETLGCTATYLVRVHAHEYNLFSPDSWSILQELKAAGHEIGLHFEAMNVGRAIGLHPERLLSKEKLILEEILCGPVRTCSEHREISGIVHSTPLFHELYDPYKAGFQYYAMDPRYCRDMKYLSDSNACWREGDLSLHLNKHDRFQVLVHADWWFEKDMLLKRPYYHPRSTHI